MKKTKTITIILIMLFVLCTLAACSSYDYSAKGAKTVNITATLTHADGVLLQKIESTFTKSGKKYDYVTNTTSINALDSGAEEMYSTVKTQGSDATLTVPGWNLDDFAAIHGSTATSIKGLVKAEKLVELGITDANGDVALQIEFNDKKLVGMTINYVNAKGSAVSIVATITY